MSAWIHIEGLHKQRLQLIPTGTPGVVTLLWEHDCSEGYYRERHRVSSDDGETWHVDQVQPLTLSPSLHCTTANGGCGLHGHVREGRWM